MIYEQLELRITKEVYHFTPLIEPAKAATGSKKIETLTILRDSGHLQLNAPLPQTNLEQEFLVYGIVGFITLLRGDYLIVITGCRKLGSLAQDADIFCATKFQILPVKHESSSELSKQQSKDEAKYLSMIHKHLDQNGFYFSYNYPITLMLQKRVNSSKAKYSNDWRDADSRFFWNKYLCEKLITTTLDQSSPQNLSSYILPMIQGFVTISQAVISNRAVTFALISRRSKERAGTRYFSRGLDEHGYVSNYVETEQLLLCDPAKSLTQENLIQASYVQTRGSVPAFWGQIPNTRYTPKLWVNTNLSDEKVLQASRAHFDQQIKFYGPQILINLTNTHGYEFPVGHVFAEIIKELSSRDLKFIHFDFHKECCKMRWNRVQLLIDQLEADLRKQAYCLYDATQPAGSNLRRVQTSVVRTNCMDCLDRTNVVQSTIARWVLNKQLQEIGILQSTEVIENDEKFMHIFQNAWADNADGLSICYSGTGALKTDFTRTGKRTRIGMLNDLSNSLIRYVKNNYMDGFRQDGIDLVLGRYKVPLHYAESPFKISASSIIIRLMPVYLLGASVIAILLLFRPSLFNIRTTLIQIVSLSFALAIVITCWMSLEYNAAELIDWPKLVPDQLVRDVEARMPDNINQHNTAKRLVHEWTRRRSSSALLNEIEQGYEMAPSKFKKTT